MSFDESSMTTMDFVSANEFMHMLIVYQAKDNQEITIGKRQPIVYNQEITTKRLQPRDYNQEITHI